jgi:hypothetical protein
VHGRNGAQYEFIVLDLPAQNFRAFHGMLPSMNLN